jgi:hypothetical protein
MAGHEGILVARCCLRRRRTLHQASACHILELLEPLQASPIGGGNRNVDLNELSGELTL